jgi:hypothetical protein
LGFSRAIASLLLAAIALSGACGVRRSAAAFHVVAGQPYYLLRSPELSEIPFPETLNGFSNQALGWVDLGERMVLKLESAYFKTAGAKRGIENYLGLESLTLEVMHGGRLRELGRHTLPERPEDQAGVADLLPSNRQKERFHRFFFQVVVDRKSGAANAVLLSGGTQNEIEQLSRRMIAEPQAVCGPGQLHCTIFPETCSVSLAFGIIVNGKPTTVPWGSVLGAVLEKRTEFTLLRSHHGHKAPVIVDGKDPQALRLPLMPGDVIQW